MKKISENFVSEEGFYVWTYIKSMFYQFCYGVIEDYTYVIQRYQECDVYFSDPEEVHDFVENCLSDLHA